MKSMEKWISSTLLFISPTSVISEHILVNFGLLLVISEQILVNFGLLLVISEQILVNFGLLLVISKQFDTQNFNTLILPCSSSKKAAIKTAISNGTFVNSCLVPFDQYAPVLFLQKHHTEWFHGDFESFRNLNS